MIHFQADDSLKSSLDAQLPERLKKAARTVLEEYGADIRSDLTLVLTSDEQIRSLNCQFRDVEAATDVLSFPAGELDPRTGAQYLGDVIISVERASINVETNQSEYQMSTLEDELVLLTVHGVLHLLGHDHADEHEKVRMWAAQERSLRSLGLIL